MLEFDGVEIAVMLKEVSEGTIKVSFRSKGRFEIHEAAMELGGGGHAFAAGATLFGDLEEARRRALAVVTPYLHCDPTETSVD